MALNKKQQQVVDQLGRRVEMCREFMNDWLLFNQIMSAYPSPGVNKAQLENQFLKVKSKLAREHKVLKDTLLEDYQIDGNTMNIVSSATSLEQIYSQSEVAVKKMQGEWHRAFISINETLGALEDKRQRAEAGEKIMIITPGATQPKSGGIDPDTQKTIMIVVAVIVVIGVLFVVNPLGYFDMFHEMLGLKSVLP